jgi:hypothetical protein
MDKGPLEKVGDLVQDVEHKAAEIVHDAEHKVADLAHEAEEGSSARTPAIVLSGVVLAVGSFVLLITGILLAIYFLA